MSNLHNKTSEERFVLGFSAFAAMSAVEGLHLTPAARARVLSPGSGEERRSRILRHYRSVRVQETAGEV
jgi:hypothetical protein